MNYEKRLNESGYEHATGLQNGMIRRLSDRQVEAEVILEDLSVLVDYLRIRLCCYIIVLTVDNIYCTGVSSRKVRIYLLIVICR